MKKIKGIKLASLGLFLAFLFGFPATSPDIYYLSFGFMLFTYIALSSSWNIIGGYAGYLSFGHAAFFGVGAYTSALLLINYGLSPFYTCIFGGVLAVILAVIFGYPGLRLRGPYFAVASLLLGLIMQVLVANVQFTGGTVGLWMPFLRVSIATNRMIFYEVMLGLALVTVLIGRWVEKSKFGLGLRAIREDEETAQTLVVNPTKLKIQALMLSAFLTGIIGGIFAYYRVYLLPHSMFDTFLSIQIVTMALFGGSTSWVGPIIGATVLTVLSEAMTGFLSIPSEVSRIIYGIVLISVIMFLPNGIVSLFKRRRAARREKL
jgi:branched-chain amino acid transport system permease protein